MESSKVEIINMKGSELEDICDLSKLPNRELLEIFKISNGTLYNYFKAKRVPDEIEEIIDAHPTLSKAKNKVIKHMVPQVSTDQAAIIQGIAEVMKAVLPSMAQSISQAIKETVSEFSSVVREQSTVLREQMDRREKDYELIRKNNAAILNTNSMIVGQFATITNQLMGQEPQPDPQQKTRPKFGPEVKK